MDLPPTSAPEAIRLSSRLQPDAPMPSPSSMVVVSPTRAEAWFLLGLVGAALLWSVLIATDRMTWFMEVMWVIAGIPVLVASWKRFPLTRLLCWLLAAHALVLIHGGAYTYAQTPLGFWLRDAGNALGMQLARNPWD